MVQDVVNLLTGGKELCHLDNKSFEQGALLESMQLIKEN